MATNNKASQFILLMIAGIFVFIGGFFIGGLDVANQKQPDYYITGDIKGEYKSVDVDMLWEVWDKLEANYLEEDLDGNVMLDGAIGGLVDSLGNPYNTYLNPQETLDYNKSNAGEFEGIGTTLKFNGEYTQIETPIDGLPASKAGLRPGDVITKVNGEAMQNKNAYEVAEKIKGKSGTQVEIEVLRQDHDEPINFKITREAIDLDSISYEELPNGIIKIKITQFTENSLGEFQNQWDNTIEEVIGRNPNKIIVDVRNNPGGYVDGVIYVASEFLPKGSLIMSERDRNGEVEEKKSSRDGKLKNIDIVVLVNEGSASAAEIFAGAIQDNKRGEVIGEKTVGKGVEQKILMLSSGASLHVVFQEWLLPSGRVITSENPITPNQTVELTEEDFRNGLDPQLDKALEMLD